MIKKLFGLCILIMLCSASAHATPSLTQGSDPNTYILTTQPGDNVQLNLAPGDQFSFVQQAATPSPTPSTSPTPPPTPTPVPSNSPTPPPSPTPVSTPTPGSATLSIDRPANGATVAGNMTLNYTGSPNVSWANLLIDNQYSKSSSSGSGSFVIDTTKLVDGPHNMTVVGKSFPGNKTLVSTRIRVMVMNTTPTPVPPKH